MVEQEAEPQKVSDPIAPDANAGTKITDTLPPAVQRDLLDSKTSDLKAPVRVPTIGRAVLYFPNNADHAATTKDDKTLYFPAVVIKSWPFPVTHINLNVFTDDSGEEKGPVQFREEVKHKSELAEFGGSIKAIAEQSLPYWDWPVIEGPTTAPKN